MDPFIILPLEVCDNILQHLSGHDVLQATLVSKRWNEVVGTSMKAMDKLWLKIFWPQMIEKDIVELVVNSNRKYHHLMIKFHSYSIEGVAPLIRAMNRKVWKFVSLECVGAEKSSQFVELLRLFENSVEDLTMRNIFISSFDDWAEFNFLKLKKLKINDFNSGSRTIFDAFTGCERLTELYIKTQDFSDEAAVAVREILEKNINLAKIDVSARLLHAALERSCKLKFKLNTLIAPNYKNLRSYATHVNLLQNQLNNLQHITFHEVSSAETLKILFKMPNLKSLDLGTVDSTQMSFNTLLLNVSKTIEKLSFHDYCKKFSIMKCLVGSAPNVRDVSMFSMTQDMMEYLSLTARYLEILKLRTIDASNISIKHLFPKLTKVNVGVVSAELEDKISWIPVEKANPFVRLLKQSSYVMLH